MNNHSLEYATFETRLEDLRRDLHIPGFTAGIIRNQNLSWVKGFGIVDLDNDIEAAPNTPYHIASLTKPFCAIIILQLAQESVLSLDDLISVYGVEFESSACVRVRHLLSMTSEGVPGEAYHYDGDRFLLLDQVIKKASGKSFQELVIERILCPLKMSSTAPSRVGLREISANADTFESIYVDLAKPYKLNSEHKIVDGKYPSHFSTAAGLISTVEDLAMFDIAIDQNLLISEKMKKRMFAPALSKDGKELPYGLGWYAQKIQGVWFNWHWGQWDCVSSLVVKVPEEKITFLILANNENLSRPFDLGQGNVLRSPFATAFYETFIQRRQK